MATIANNLLAEVDKKVLESFQSGAKAYITKYQDVFDIKVPERKDEQFSILALNNAVTQVNDGGAYAKSDINEVGLNQISMQLFKESVQLSDFSTMYDNYGSIAMAAMDKGRQFNFKIDQMGASYIDNAASSSTPYGFTIGGTSTSLVSNTNVIGITGETYDNRITGSLNKTSLNNAYTALKKMPGHDGNIAGYQAKRLLVPQDQEMNAWQIVRSAGEPESANNNFNFTNTMGLELIVWPLLSSSSACLLMADKGYNGSRGVICTVKQMPKVKRIISQNTGCPEYQIDMAIAFGFVDWLGVVGIDF